MRLATNTRYTLCTIKSIDVCHECTLPIDVELQKASPEELCLKFHTLDEPNTSTILQRACTASGDSKAEHPGSTAEAEKELWPEACQAIAVPGHPGGTAEGFYPQNNKGGKLKEHYLGP